MDLFKRLKELRDKKKALAEERAKLIKEIRSLATEENENEARSKSLEKEKIEVRMEFLEEEVQNVLDKIEEERNNLPNPVKVINGNKDKNDTRSLQLRAMANTVLNRGLSEEQRDVISSDKNGAIIPEEFVNQFEKLREGYSSLKQYCNVIPVNSLSGKMPVRKNTTPTKLADLVKDKELVKAMIETSPLAYDINDYGLLAPIDNSLLEDSNINFLEYVNEEFAQCAVNTENAEIIKILSDLLTEKAATSYDDLVKAINTLSPNARNNSIIITNSEGRAYLDGLMDKQGRPLLKELTDGGNLIFKGRPVVEVDGDSMTVTAGQYEFFIVDTKTLIKFFDRKQYLIDKSTEAGYTTNQTIVRIIQRMDIKGAIEKTDTRLNKFGARLVIKSTATA